MTPREVPLGVRLHRWIGFHAGWRRLIEINDSRISYLTLGCVSLEWHEAGNDAAAARTVAKWQKQARERIPTPEQRCENLADMLTGDFDA